ncbi:MAG: DUF1559 domain-containing protein [Planctomycetota bacterium]
MTRQRWLELGVVAGIMILLLALLLPAVHRAREEARKSASKNNLKQIGLALHNYYDTHRCFPPGGIIREDGLAMHGWITMLLPFFDADPIYNSINLSVSWSNTQNQEFFQRTRFYMMVPGTTEYYTSHGYALTNYLANPHLVYRNSSVTFDQLKKGTAHTWFSGEVAGKYQPWGYPFNWRPLGTKLCAGPDSYGHLPWQGGHLLFADGSVTFFSEQTSAAILKKFAEAPPVPIAEQTAVPNEQFETVGLYWKKEPLQVDPNAKRVYYVNVLRGETPYPFKLELYFLYNPQRVEEDEPDRMTKSSGPYLLFEIDKTTDLTQALKSSSMSDDATPTQVKEILSRLETLQEQLP